LAKADFVCFIFPPSEDGGYSSDGIMVVCWWFVGKME
jgi:hypothetical protein